MNIDKLISKKQFKEALEQAEKDIYLKAYDSTKRNQSATARLLGVARGTVISKLRKFITKET